MNEDVLIACADLVGRSGASHFEIGYLRDDVPAEEAGWYVSVRYQGSRITTDEHRSPSTAAFAMAERILSGATCRCGETVALSGDRPGCRWRLVGQRWEPGCDAPSVRVDGERGDLAAMQRAMGNRAQRRANKRERKRS